MHQSDAKKQSESANCSKGLPPAGSLRRRFWIALPVFGFGILGVLWIARAAEKAEAYAVLTPSLQKSADPAPAKDSSVFTPAHRTIFEAVREFFFVQPTPVQPIAFNHKLHLQNGLQCTNCHAGVTQGPNAGIPSVTFCMACHQVIAADHPEIKKLAAYAAQGQEVPWQRVYWFYPTAHVQFWHAPHINAGVSCEQCHGDMSQRTVAVKTNDLTMNFCLNCHKAKGVSVDCTTCHY